MKSSGLICLPLVVLAGCATQKLTEATCIVAHEVGLRRNYRQSGTHYGCAERKALRH